MDAETPAVNRGSESDERQRIEAAQKDPRRFADLYEEHFARVYAYIVRRVRDRSEAQDLVSEVFQQALANLHRFEWRGTPFAAWLYRIAANAVADHFRRTSRQTSVPPGEDMARDELEAVEQRASLFRQVDRLPTDQRRVIVMRFAEEKSIREIAKDLGRSEGAIKQLQWRGLQTLRKRLGTRHG
jgi:RNA polymerase sigma-70 factor (ECF subfamily)